jgi:hypothetical protein
MEGAVKQVLDLQDLGEIGQKFYGDEPARRKPARRRAR